MTGYLSCVNALMRPYRGAAEPLAEMLRASGSSEILDLCSGSGGPWPELGDELTRLGLDATVVCSDLYPDRAAAKRLEGQVGFRMHPAPVSALAVPAELAGTRTLFTALHHFEPQQVKDMLLDAQRAGRYFAAFEITHRSFKGLATTFAVPILALFLLPRVRPRRWLPLLFSYLPPIVPLAIGWDGMVSTFRSYRKEELEAMVAELGASDYEWRVAEFPSGTPLPMTCILGRPLPP